MSTLYRPSGATTPRTYLTLTGVRELDAVIISYLSTTSLMEVVRHFDSSDVTGSVPDMVWYHRLGQAMTTQWRSWWYSPNVPIINRQANGLSYWDLWLACVPRPCDADPILDTILARLSVAYTRMDKVAKGRAPIPDAASDYPIARFIIESIAASMQTRVDVMAWLALHVGVASGYVALVEAALDIHRDVRDHVVRRLRRDGQIPPRTSLPIGDMLAGHRLSDLVGPPSHIPYSDLGYIGQSMLESILASTFGYPIPYDSSASDAREFERAIGRRLMGVVQLPTSRQADQCHAECIGMIADHVLWCLGEFPHLTNQHFIAPFQWKHAQKQIVVTATLIGEATLRACVVYAQLNEGIDRVHIADILSHPLQRRHDHEATLELINLVPNHGNTHTESNRMESLYLAVLDSYSLVATDAASSLAYMDAISRIEDIGEALVSVSHLPLSKLFNVNPPRSLAARVAKILVICHGIMTNEESLVSLSRTEWISLITKGCNYTTWGSGSAWTTDGITTTSHISLERKPMSWSHIITSLLWTNYELAVDLLTTWVDRVATDRSERGIKVTFSPQALRGLREAALASNTRDKRAIRLVNDVTAIHAGECIQLLLDVALRHEHAGLDALAIDSPAKLLFNSLRARMSRESDTKRAQFIDILHLTSYITPDTYNTPALTLPGLAWSVQSLLLTSSHLSLFPLLLALYSIRNPPATLGHRSQSSRGPPGYLYIPLVDLPHLSRESMRALIGMFYASMGTLGYHGDQCQKAELIKYAWEYRWFEAALGSGIDRMEGPG